MKNIAVELKGVGKDYPHFRLQDVNLKLETGTVMGFIGANGAGKSTTLRILMGLVHQDRGEVTVFGSRMPQQQALAKRDIGYVSEDLRLYGTATLGWHMSYIRSIYPGWDSAYAAHLCRHFDLNPAQKIKGLSTGQRVKASLLLAFARRPRLLVLDEPTTGLDPVARHEVLEALMEAMRDESRTILFSSHNTHDVEQISDQITFIDRGRVIESDDKETFLDRWRRFRLEVPPGVCLPVLPGTVATSGSARLAVVTTSRYDDSLAAAYTQAGVSVKSIDSMTLEEIFVANVHSKREEVAA